MRMLAVPKVRNESMDPADVASISSSKENIGLLSSKTLGKKRPSTLFLEAAAIRRKVFGPDHASTKKSETLAATCE